MVKSDTAAPQSGQLRVELLIVGGGIMGLWAALHAERQGIDTLLVDEGPLARGASGGLLGALMPHMPDRWSEKKQFQFDALIGLEEEVGRMEAETGLSAGYRRSGRLIPLPKPHLRVIAERHCKDAETHWHHGARSFSWTPLDASPAGTDWPSEEFMAAGIVYDTFAARVSPRSLTAMLTARLNEALHVRIIENSGVALLHPETHIARLSDGRTVAFGHCIIAAGHRSFPMLESLGAPLPLPLGQPVKGQAALLKADIDPALPLLYLDGLYIVPHEGGYAAIGSTSEDRFDDPGSTDEQLEELIGRARGLAPALRDAEVVERWAGLRPKAIDRDPMVGPHPDHPRIHALTGGFKVSFGLAHRLAEAAVAGIAGRLENDANGLPQSFTLHHHIVIAARNA
ncbi:FAD-binding oxidoreductase [Rhizobium daejeonense]|uniref:FAD-binding oxidoreductase n=1 Tax=Rhizobium daejeonense TaxID=240521 RepID=A0A6M1RLS5_9HYPH|nr:FAD-binding oxidoreductase [Rhizobium daejeonense]NGO62504.1 FAD-binding oxidoreductase [Rhizobium daejeonense]